MDWVIDFLERYGIYAIFLVTMLEYVCFPIPSEVLMPLCGMAAAALRLPLVWVVAVTLVAGLTGSSLCYAVGALGGRPLLDKLFGRFPGAQRKLNACVAWQARYGKGSVMIARVIPFFRTWISFIAGLGKQKLGDFLLFSGVGILVWNTVFLMAGYALEQEGMAKAAGPGFLPIAAIAGWVLFFLIKHLVKKGANPIVQKTV